MIDVSTQTFQEMGTQTPEIPPAEKEEEEEEDEVEESLVEAAKILLLSAKKNNTKKGRFGGVRSMSFNPTASKEPVGQPRSPVQNGPGDTSPFNSSPVGGRSEEELLTDLNDLEEELALMRFKALSLKEQIKWIQQEKVCSFSCCFSRVFLSIL